LLASGTGGSSVWRECLALGALLAVFGAFAPAILPLSLVAACALGLGGLLEGSWRASLRGVAVGSGGVLVALALLLPWSITYLQSGARLSALFGAAPADAPRLAALLHFDVGPVGHGLLGWALLAAAAGVLLIGRAERLAWGTRWWITALGTVAFSFGVEQGAFGAGGGALALLLAPGAAALSACVGLGAASLAHDLPRARLGWRHGVSALAVLCGLAGLVPVLAVLPGGRFDRPSTGYDTVLALPTPPGASAATTRVLWLGAPAALPLPGWQVEPGLAAAVSGGPLPDSRRLLLAPNPGLAAAAVEAVQAAEGGTTVELGHLLSAERITAIVVPTATAPDLGAIQHSASAPPPAALLRALLVQSDLHELPRQGGAYVFENAAWRAGPAARPHSGMPAPVRILLVVAELAAWAAAALALRGRRSSGLRPAHSRAAPTAPTPALEPAAVAEVATTAPGAHA
jgi:hypothetical protein